MSNFNLIEKDDFHAAMESAWKGSFMAVMRADVRDELATQSGFKFSRKLPGLIQEFWPIIREATIVDPFRLGWILDMLHETLEVEGDIAECGSFRGGSAILMALTLKRLRSDKKIHVFDSFEGLPEPDASKDKGYKKGQFKGNYEVCVSKIRELGLEDTIHVHKGWFNETIGAVLKEEDLKLSLFHVDCDLYESTRDCFSLLYPRVSRSGMVILDDFNDGGRGEKLAVLELSGETRELFHVGPAPQCSFKKGQSVIQGGTVVTDAGSDYAFDQLFQDTNYCEWLNEVMGTDFKQDILRFVESGQERLEHGSESIVDSSHGRRPNGRALLFG
jgi:hypothetical protein